MSHVEIMSLNEQESMESSEQESQPHLHEVQQEEPKAEAEELSSPVEGQTKEKGQKQHYEQFLAELEKQPDADAKLYYVITFMENSLSQHGSPHFKSFWEARNLCLDLFKENINPALRSEMWTKYTELSKEARRLKEILDEQSAFAAEQIEIAIKALESEISKNQDKLDLSNATPLLPICKSLEGKAGFYEVGQRELNLLNVQASRINALRKELIRTEMRVRQKNKFFQQLSSAGDLVFPRRKELIKEISQHFINDVEAFVKTYFDRDKYQESFFFLREEIKMLQGVAKLLTLNTNSFTQTRMRLSECWDKIKHIEKERKKERAQQKEVFKANASIVKDKIEEFKTALAEGQLSSHAGNEKIDEIFALMKQTELGRDEVKELREEIAIARKPLQDKMKAEEEARHAADLERDRLRKEKIQALRDEIDHLIRTADALEVDELTTKRDQHLQDISQAPITKQEKVELERSLKPLKDIITEKREKALMNLSDDDRHALDQLKELLKQRRERRLEIKNQIEIYRKASGSSGLDFEKAMTFNQQMAEEKERLEKLNEGIREIENKVAELENKI